MWVAFSKWEAGQNGVVKAKIVILRDDIASRVFWDEVGDVYHVMMRVILTLRQLDFRAPNTGKVYMAWWTIQESLRKPWEPHESYVKPWKIPFNKAKQETLGKLVHARCIDGNEWKKMADYLSKALSLLLFAMYVYMRENEGVRERKCVCFS